jgi:NADPH-dependent glutamate synthase beta subunit-like oxidoreductase
MASSLTSSPAWSWSASPLRPARPRAKSCAPRTAGTQGKEFDYARQRAKGKGIRFVRSRNVAVDCARAALRLGYGPVTILYRRTREEMPAYLEEVENALLEGIEIRFLVAPVAVEGKDGKVTGLTCQRLKLGEPDASGRRRQYWWRTRSSPFPAK